MKTGTYKDKIETNSNKIAPFVRWYVDTPIKDRTKARFDKDVRGTCACEFENAIKEWLIRSDVQDSILEYMKCKKFLNVMNIYDSMCQKAMAGDVNASKFVVEFTKSSFFSNEEDEADQYLDGIDIPSLKAGDK